MHNIKMELPNIDLVIGSVLIPGDKAPHLITKDMLKMMKTGNRSRRCCRRLMSLSATTHSEPTM